MEPSQNTTSFGFQTVNEEDKQGLVRGVFDAVADKYDIMNDLMSAGLHRLWKQRLVDSLHIRPHADGVLRLIDMAGGTGDIAFRACQRADKLSSQISVQVVDANEQMVGVGAKRGRDNGFDQVDFITGTAEALPVADQSADYVTIAFGIRNVTHRDRALAESYRVLKPGGRFVCLEFSHMPLKLAQKFYDAYSFNVIPPMGKAITGDASAYQYLIESIRQFPKAEAFMEEVAAAGFARCQFQRLNGGIAALHSGWRI
ncbi:MAG: bifunctional demethylmenaquinone methyltransferase/2-methoxy-6-polyprenyl-1,4-benzoquinol methylase UbiE [Parvibaculales bacterium]